MESHTQNLFFLSETLTFGSFNHFRQDRSVQMQKLVGNQSIKCCTRFLKAQHVFSTTIQSTAIQLTAIQLHYNCIINKRDTTVSSSYFVLSVNMLGESKRKQTTTVKQLRLQQAQYNRSINNRNTSTIQLRIASSNNHIFDNT
jgi:hypothetical protein